MKYYLLDIILVRCPEIKTIKRYEKEEILNLLNAIFDKFNEDESADSIYFYMVLHKIMCDIEDSLSEIIIFDKKSLVIVHQERKNMFSFFGEKGQTYLLTSDIDVLNEADFNILNMNRFKENFTLLDSEGFLKILQETE